MAATAEMSSAMPAAVVMSSAMATNVDKSDWIFAHSSGHVIFPSASKPISLLARPVGRVKSPPSESKVAKRIERSISRRSC